MTDGMTKEELKAQYEAIKASGKMVDHYEEGWLAGARQETWKVGDRLWYVEFQHELNERFEDPVDIREIADYAKVLREDFLLAHEKREQDSQKEENKKDPKKVLQCLYKNWKGENNLRNVVPLDMWFGTSQYHQGEQWFMKVFDVDKQAERDFAVKDMLFR